MELTAPAWLPLASPASPTCVMLQQLVDTDVPHFDGRIGAGSGDTGPTRVERHLVDVPGEMILSVTAI